MNLVEKTKNIIIPRITQLDANTFDDELNRLFFNQLLEITKYFKPGTVNNVKSELNLLLNLIVFKYSIAQNGSTFGQRLVALQYEESLPKTKLVLYAVLKYILPYLRNKFDENDRWINSSLVSGVVQKVDIIAKTCHLLNLVIFLVEGKYPTVTDRLLALRYVPTSNFNRGVEYSFMTRHLVWLGFIEIFRQIVPLINYKKIKRKFKMIFSGGGETRSKGVVQSSNTCRLCVICNDSIIIPCVISEFCPHFACYYCLKTNLMADSKFSCPECNEPNTVSEKMIYLKFPHWKHPQM